MPDYDENYVSGCHGTVAEQLDEAYYDDRSDADDDMEKGRIKFPKDKLYGREKELGILRQLYNAMETHNNSDEEVDAAAAAGGQRISFEGSSPSNVDSRVVFLSGYSGVGKSALVAEFINQIQREHNNSAATDNFSPVLHFSGKYIQQSAGAAPFSAISEVFGNIVSSLFNGQKGNKYKESENDIRSLCTKIWKRVQNSDVIGSDTDGNEVLIEIFPSLRPLLDGSVADTRNKLQRVESISNLGKEGEPSMNAVKESTRELLAQITSSLQRPLILFLDDLQWADGPSLELLSFLMAKDAQLKDLMLICAYRSNEVGGDHPFANIMAKVTESRGPSVAKVDLFSLSQDAICRFIADSIGMEEQDRVAELVEVIYPKTMGNIFCVMQALEELVRKNALYYDMMYFEWRWTVDKVELANQVSADVVETIKDKIKGLSVDIQKLLAVMAHIPCSVGVPVLKELLVNYEGNGLNEDQIASLLKEASENGMLMWSNESGNYIFSHDRIREASRGYVVEQDRDELLLHMAHVLLRLGKGSKMEWCLYTAVDLLNSLSPDKVDTADLIKLNLRVSKMAKSRGSPEMESMLLRESMERLKPSKWKDYNLSLELYNAVIASEYNLGNHDRMSAAINEVLDHATFLRDRYSAYLFMVKHLSDNDYRAGSHEGVKVLNMFSYNIPLQPTKVDMAREKTKLRFALKGRSFASLINLQVRVTEDPIFELFAQVCRDSLFSRQPRLTTVVAWTAVRRAIKKGMDGYLPQILGSLAQVHGKKGNVIAANEIGNVVLTLSENFRDMKVQYSLARFINQAGIMFHLQSFRSGVDLLQQCYKDLRFLGQFEPALGSQLNCNYAYLAAGLPLGTIFESKLLVLEEFCKSIGKGGYVASFEIHRQFAMNLRQRSDYPTLLNGPAFQQDTALATMNDQAREMTLRDASIFRLELAFIFNDTKCMAEMLETLSGYPFEDQVIPRFYIRACFMGLAAFSLAEKKYHAIGNQCLKYFRRMKKLGSTNAPPAYYLIAASKKPTKKAFTSAIDSCREASMPHLEAIAKERYAMFLLTQNESNLAHGFITSAYWLYFDWGAHGKLVSLAQEYPFLKNAKRAKTGSHVSSRSDTVTSKTFASGSVQQSRGVHKRQGTFEYNSTLISRRLIKN